MNITSKLEIALDERCASKWQLTYFYFNQFIETELKLSMQAVEQLEHKWFPNQRIIKTNLQLHMFQSKRKPNTSNLLN